MKNIPGNKKNSIVIEIFVCFSKSRTKHDCLQKKTRHMFFVLAKFDKNKNNEVIIKTQNQMKWNKEITANFFQAHLIIN